MPNKLTALLFALFPPTLYTAVRTAVYAVAGLLARSGTEDIFAENRARLALRNAQPWLLIGSAALTLIIFALIFRGTPLLRFVGTARPRLPSVAAMIEIGLGLNLALTALILLLPLPADWFAEHTGGVSDPLGEAGLAVKLLCTVIAAPLAEEVVFRGLTQRFLLRGFSPGFAVLWQAVFFAAFHGTKLQMIYVLPAGIVLGLVYRRSGTLLAPIILHMAFNAYSELSIPLPRHAVGLAACLLGGGAVVTFAMLGERRRSLHQAAPQH
ncbi:MAG: CPBP family intramembrane metalloprotease [Oscillospiraceae bacterium]|jgi:membrane protease YdiL (CAAX protease family)|nr:CPBP family intramembrane metalloprotease [Oscillospiraceae bacterium]